MNKLNEVLNNVDVLDDQLTEYLSELDNMGKTTQSDIINALNTIREALKNVDKLNK